MTKTTKIILRTTIGILAFIGALTIAVMLYYAPVIDRLARPCHHYPHTFIDCK